MGTTEEGLPETTRRTVEAFLDEWRAREDVPGLSAALLDGEGVLHATGMGASDVATRAPATPDTRYPVGSVTKLFTATAVLQLVDRGDLRLDEEIREHVEQWSNVPGEPITVTELLSHSSGMPRDYAGEREFLFADDPPASPLLTPEDVRRHVDAAGDRRVVDEDRFMYSNRGYKLLGELVEAVDGRSFEAVVEAEVLDPLGMDDATIGYGSLADVGDAITGYSVEDGVPEPTDYDLDRDRVGPASAGGLLCSVRELARFVRCLLDGGELEGTRVLAEDLVDAMSRVQSPPVETVDGDEWGAGYGPQVDTFLGERVVFHTGTSPGVARAYAGFLTERGLGATIGANTGDVPMEALGKGVLAIAADEDPLAVVPGLALRGKCRAVAGTYEGFRGGMTVTVEPAETMAAIDVTLGGGDGPRFTAVPESTAHDEHEFYAVRATGLRAELSFRDHGDRMELRFGGHRLDRTGG